MGSRRRFLKAAGLGISSIGVLGTQTSARKQDTRSSDDSHRRLNPVERKNVTPVGYHDLQRRPGFKMGIWETEGRWYLYIGHLFHSGWSVLDVTDPRNPTLENFIEGPPNTWTLQMQTIDGRLVTNYEQPAEGWDPVDGPQLNEDEEFTSGIGIWDIVGHRTSLDPSSYINVRWASFLESGARAGTA